MADPVYPTGKRPAARELAPEERLEMIEAVAVAPALVRQAVRGLSDEQLDVPYREGGWGARQVVHHVADSHMQGFIRFKLALTEDEPAAKTWLQPAWGLLPDAAVAAPGPSLDLLDGLHARWVLLLRAMVADMRPEVWSRTYLYGTPEPHRLDEALIIYAWHGRHHAAQITGLRERMGWAERQGR